MEAYNFPTSIDNISSALGGEWKPFAAGKERKTNSCFSQSSFNNNRRVFSDHEFEENAKILFEDMFRQERFNFVDTF